MLTLPKLSYIVNAFPFRIMFFFFFEKEWKNISELIHPRPSKKKYKNYSKERLASLDFRKY